MLTNHEATIYHAAGGQCYNHTNVTIMISYSREHYKICLPPKNVAFLLKGKIPNFSNNHPTKTPQIQFNPKLTLIPFPCQTMLPRDLIFSIELISDWKDFHTASYIYCYAFIFRPYILKILTICVKLYEIPACTHIINVWGTEILPDIGLFYFSATNTFIQTGQGTF